MVKEKTAGIKTKEVFKNVFEIDFDDVPEESKNENLLSSRINFRARDLLTLLWNLEQEFNIEYTGAR